MRNKTKTKVALLFILSTYILLFSALLTVMALTVSTTLTVTNDILVFVRWATPERRVGASETNDDILFFLSFKNPFNHENIYNTDFYNTANDGTYLDPIQLSPGISAGTYDVGFKSSAHLTKILRSVIFSGGSVGLNFTQSDNSSLKGGLVLIAGDISGDGTSPQTLGDDVINSVDLSQMIIDLDSDDPTGNVIRANLNQDSVVNSVDLSLMIANIDKEGEK